VTGLGVITPLGTGVEKTWKAICAGESGIGRITKFDPAAYDAQIAGEVKDFDPAQFIDQKNGHVHPLRGGRCPAGSG
jgi:3-oxoacyl-[acyl-carrier-protein] synthase II